MIINKRLDSKIKIILYWSFVINSYRIIYRIEVYHKPSPSFCYLS